uniref:ArdC family protein n=1 Tax=Pedobacter schmidteae TaxID=2201271 RepID=UPI0013CF0CE7|nr:zincin-like metallopeptidase domain-containing protein [Pedobacter schmidteae]
MSTKPEAPKALHVQVAEKLIERLKSGTAPWQRPWNSAGIPAFQLPYNVISGNRYKGINTFSLLLAGYDDPRWMTYNQAASKDWQVRKGEHGTTIQYVRFYDERTKRDESGKPILGTDGKPEKELVKLEKPIVNNAKVFNARQVDGIRELKITPPAELGWDPLERAEQLINSTGADIFHRAGNQAYYSLLADQITMPLKAQFDSPGKYYATVLHEAGHWSGHPSRLDRGLINKFGSEGYAREELRAEIASLLIGQELQIGHDPGQHVAYVKDWVKILTDTPFEIHAAAADAEKIFNFLLDFERKLDLTQGQQPQNEQIQRIPSSKSLLVMDEIGYNGTVYRIASHLKQGRFKVEDLGSGAQFILSKSDGLYASLLQAKAIQVSKPVLDVTSAIAKQYDQEPETSAAYGLKR